MPLDYSTSTRADPLVEPFFGPVGQVTTLWSRKLGPQGWEVRPIIVLHFKDANVGVEGGQRRTKAAPRLAWSPSNCAGSFA